MKEQEHIKTVLQTIQPMNLTSNDQQKFVTAEKCCICEKTFSIFDKQYGRIV